jgi:hypothetical protein
MGQSRAIRGVRVCRPDPKTIRADDDQRDRPLNRSAAFLPHLTDRSFDQKRYTISANESHKRRQVASMGITAREVRARPGKVTSISAEVL